MGATCKQGATCIGGDNLLVPGEARKAIAKQLPANRTIRAVAANHIVRRQRLGLAAGRLHADPRAVVVLANGHNLVVEPDLADGLVAREVVGHERQQLVERQRHHGLAAGRVVGAHGADGRRVCGRAHDAPADAVGHKGLLHDVVHEPRAAQLVDGGCAVEACARVAVNVVCFFEHRGADALLGEEEGDDEPCGAGAHDDDLVGGGHIGPVLAVSLSKSCRCITGDFEKTDGERT